MKKIQEKEDKLVSEFMKDFRMESPSEEFTDRVIQSIELENRKSSLKTSPIISRTGWIGIAAGILGMILILFFIPESQPTAEAGWLTQFFSMLNLPTIELSFTDFYSRINFGNPTLFWISIGLAGLALLALLERILESINRQFYLL